MSGSDASEYYPAGSYQQQQLPQNIPVSATIGSAGQKTNDDEAYAQRLQQEEFNNARPQVLPTVTGHPVRSLPPDGTRYVTMYPTPATFDPAQLGVPGNFIAPHEARLMEVFSLGRTIRFLAILDGIILLFNCAYFPVLYLLLWAPLAGWMAGTRFSTAWTYAYLCYYVMRLSVDLAYVLTGYIWFVVVFAVNLIIARYLLRFVKLLNTLTPAEIEQLRNPGTVWAGHDPRRPVQPFQVL